MKMEPEIQAVMDWTKSRPFVMSVALQGGAVLTSYPYKRGMVTGKITVLIVKHYTFSSVSIINGGDV